MLDGYELQNELLTGHYENMRKYLIGKIREIPAGSSSMMIPAFAETRVMPPGTPRPGKWENSYTQYLVESMEFMSPNSPIQRDITMKAAQGGWTAATETVIAYYMKIAPADIMYLSATDKLLERWASRRLEPMIDNFGIRDLIAPIAQGVAGKKTGDTMMAKEYQGCRLDLASAQSPPSIRSSDKRIMVRDEIDGAKKELNTGEGSFMKVSYVRTNAWGDRRKIMDLSTPTTYENSLIWQEYQLGDQRVFLIPCPKCGCFQELRFGDPDQDKNYGIRTETKGGKLQYVYYLCEHCRDAIWDHEKENFIPLGYWEPTSETTNRKIASRHWSALYSPSEMTSFEELYDRYKEAQLDPDGMRSFRNLYLGLPFKEKSARPKAENMIELKGDYKSRTIPEGVLFLTMGIDVQAGKENDPKFPARLELEVVGHGRGYKTWSIEYRTIVGATDNENLGAWRDFDEMLRENYFVYERRDGMVFEPRLTFTDSGHKYHVVLRFCERWTSIHPSKGFGTRGFDKERRKKDGKGDEYSASNYRRYRAAYVQGGDTLLYEMATNHYKSLVYGALKIPRSQHGDNPPGFCDFPIDYDKQYFKGLTAEEVRTDGSFHETTIPNEPLDCRVMNLCAADAYLDSRVDRLRKHYKKQGYSEQEVSKINKKKVLQLLEKQTAYRGVQSRSLENQNAAV